LTDRDLRWRKSSYSAGGQQCVEVARTSTGAAVRDSKNPTGPRLEVGPGALAELIAH
jgi:hypothetical protein